MMDTMKAIRIAGAEATDVWWVTQARGRLECRRDLTFIHSDGKRLVGTDGKRLHRLLPDKPIPEGNYSPIVVNKSLIYLIEETEKGIKFPDGTSLIYRVKDKPKQFVLSVDPSSAFACIVRAMPEKWAFNFSYLEQAMKCRERLNVHAVPTKEDPAPAYLKDRDGKYEVLIMPLRIT